MQKKQWKLDREVQYVVGQKDSKPVYLRLPEGHIITEVSSSVIPVQERVALNNIINEGRARGEKVILHQLPNGKYTTLRVQGAEMISNGDTQKAWWRS